MKRTLFYAIFMIFNICVSISIASDTIDSASVPYKIQLLLNEKEYSPQSVGVLIRELGNDKFLYSRNAQTPYIPASVSKLVTGAVGLDILGLDYVFTTDVYIDGTLKRDTGELDGNLYIGGSGDPGFLVERLWLFVQHLSHLGIKEIKKDLILDDFFFDSITCGPGFDEEKSSKAYQASIGALSASFNCVAIHVRPGDTIGSPVHVDLFPKLNDVKIVATAKTIGNRGNDGIEIKTEKMDNRIGIYVYGSMKLNSKPRYIYRKTWHTWKNFGNVLKAFFDENGIKLAGTIKHQPIPVALKKNDPFYVFESQPFSEYIKHMFKYSSNFAAEMIFKTIAAKSDSMPGSWSKGSKVVLKWWEKNKLSGKPVIKNGSGMGSKNRLTPQQVVELLTHMWEQKEYMPECISQLAIAGVDGTLKDRFKNSPLKGVVRAKTGTLNNYGVSTLAGYVLLPKKSYVFAILINNPNATQFTHWTIQQKILEMVLLK